MGSWLAYLSAVVCLVLFLLAKRMWNWNLSHYQSAGG